MLALSHQLALVVACVLKSDEKNLPEANPVALASPTAWTGKSWGRESFD